MLKAPTPTSCLQQKLCEATLTSALLFKYRSKFLLSFGDTASAAAARPASVSRGVRLTRGGPTPGVAARSAALYRLSSKRELQVSNIQLGLGLPSDFTPPISSLLFFLSPSVFPASLLVSSRAKNTSCHYNKSPQRRSAASSGVFGSSKHAGRTRRGSVGRCERAQPPSRWRF